MSMLQGWADLPNDLLYSVLARLGSFPDLLAFAATCPSWRASFSSYPSKSTLLPPLLLQPGVPACCSRPRPLSNNLVLRRSCHVTDLANKDTYMCCQIPQFACFFDSKSPSGPLDEFFWGSVSYGHLILANRQQSCLLVDVFTGVSVSAPQLPVNGRILLNYAALTAPLSSPNSHLLVNVGCHNFFWRVGSASWLRRSPRNGTIKQVLLFKGQVFGMDHDRRLYMVHLEGHLVVQIVDISV
uniref:F-box domain-containing protein n=1 Tax=Triticum urartu TaxID=4572 RepID=A0A8R7QZF7_TRIUA